MYPYLRLYSVLPERYWGAFCVLATPQLLSITYHQYHEV